MASSPTVSPASARWGNILFYVTIAAVAAMTWQQATGGNGDPIARTIAFALPMAFPIGMAYWGKRTGMAGPALGGIAMAALFWIALLMSGGAQMGNMS